MTVTYEFAGEALTFEIEDSDDLSEILSETTCELGLRHPELERDPGLTATVADRMLNCLCDDAEWIDLGQLP
jgi:hypothetical protein